MDTALRVAGLFGCSEGSRCPKFTPEWAGCQKREGRVGRCERFFKEEDDNMVTDHLQKTGSLKDAGKPFLWNVFMCSNMSVSDILGDYTTLNKMVRPC